MPIKRSTTVQTRHRAMVARSQPPCHICGLPIDYSLAYPDPMSYVLDHLVPLARGGEDTLANKRAAHRACNRTKGAGAYAPAILRRSNSLAR